MRIDELTQAERKQQAGGVQADQFFLLPQQAQHLAQWIKTKPFFSKVTRIIDPCTGAGAISKFFPNCERYDLHPQDNETKQQDYLTSNFKPSTDGGTLVIQNSPYGSHNNLAIAFFQKSAQFADYIAQVVPRTFRRMSIQNKLHNQWQLVDQYDLPYKSFYLPAEGKIIPYDVPSTAQLWQRVEEPRTITPQRKDSQLFQWTRDANEADFAIRMHGRRAGQLVPKEEFNMIDSSPSFYFIKGDITPFEKVDWDKLGNDVMGPRHLSKPDIVAAVENPQ